MTITATDKVRELLRDGTREFGHLDSASLRLNKFVQLSSLKDQKAREIAEVCKLINRSVKMAQYSHWQLPVGMAQGGRSLVLKLEGRLAIHLAGGILENAGMCIHPHFNCPWLPGSGVKGVARHAAWTQWQESKLKDQAFALAWVFGYPTGDELLDCDLVKLGWNHKMWAGMVSFLPAFPIAADFKAMKDILTSHHPGYYAGKCKKSYDTENPIPLPFPVIESGSAFRFVLRPARRVPILDDAISMDEALDMAEQFLRKGMTLYGAGSKTAAGYGWFSEDQELTQSLNDEAEVQAKEEALARENAKREAERLALLSPEQRDAEAYLDSFGSGDVAGTIKGKMASIASLDKAEQLNICMLLRDFERFQKIWSADSREADKAANQNEKKRSKNKSFRRVKAVRVVAGELGVELS